MLFYPIFTCPTPFLKIPISSLLSSWWLLLLIWLLKDGLLAIDSFPLWPNSLIFVYSTMHSHHISLSIAEMLQMQPVVQRESIFSHHQLRSSSGTNMETPPTLAIQAPISGASDMTPFSGHRATHAKTHVNARSIASLPSHHEKIRKYFWSLLTTRSFSLFEQTLLTPFLGTERPSSNHPNWFSLMARLRFHFLPMTTCVQSQHP